MTKQFSAPSFGIKLLVSLVLLAMAIYMVKCVDNPSVDTTPTSSSASGNVQPQNPVEIEQRVIEISRDDLLVVINDDPKLKYRFTEPEIKHKVGNLNGYISNETVSTTYDFNTYRSPGNGEGESTFCFYLPTGKTITDLLTPHLTKLSELMVDPVQDSSFKAELVRILKNTKEYSDSFISPEPSKSETVSLEVLEKELCKSFSFDDSILVEGGTITNSNKNTMLFAPTDELEKMDFKVYLPSGSIVEFLKECAKGHDQTPASFMKKILGSLKEPTTPETSKVVLWSSVLTELGNFGYKEGKIIHKNDATDVDDFIKYENLCDNTEATFSSKHVYVTVSKVPNSLSLIDYLKRVFKVQVIEEWDKGSVRKQFIALVKSAQQGKLYGQCAPREYSSSNITTVSMSKDDLFKEIYQLLKDIPDKLIIAREELVLPSSSTEHFSVVSSSDTSNPIFKLTIPYCKQQPQPTDTAILSSYFKFIKGKVEGDLSRVEVLEKIFKLCWSEDSIKEYLTELKKPSTATAPVDITPIGDSSRNITFTGNGLGGTTSTEPVTSGSEETTVKKKNSKEAGEKKTNYKVAILITCSVVLGAIVVVVVVVALAQRKKQPEEAKRKL